ncbi:MAG TPA: DUF3369 domain-containing protein [Albitalea sp.]|nr:DUF3369 domain-containing protein [Albitalea sp.]
MNAFANEDLLWGDPVFEQEGAQIPPGPEKTWKVLIVDDEQDVHSVTRLALSGFEFQNMGLSFHSAHSAAEARQLMGQHPDTALILLDVVMEQDNAGLDFARHVREDLENHLVRIVLRTGQPGQAPERRIIHDYDINDYKTKTELTVDRLYTTIVAALRSYNDLKTIDASRKGLKKIVDASATVFQRQSFEQFIGGVLEQITALLCLNEDSLYCHTQSFFSADDGTNLVLVAGTGSFAPLARSSVEESLPPEIVKHLREAQRHKRSVYNDQHNVIYIRSGHAADNMIYFEKKGPISKLDHDLVEVFCSNLSTAFDNIRLNAEIEATQKEIVFSLGEIAESRSKETGYHVKRVAEYAKLLALKVGLPASEAELLRHASPLHDIGKIGIPDAILNKPGKLTGEEWEVMQTHARLGHEMLKHSKTAILKAASIVALHHHERWDGDGYPERRCGEDIHIYGRITALADVFDALGSPRCYKQAWPLEDILQLIAAQRGKQFDPTLVDLFLAHLDEFLAIRDRYVDRCSGD